VTNFLGNPAEFVPNKPAGTVYSITNSADETGKDVRTIKVIDACGVHKRLLEGIFDFEAIKGLVAHPDFSCLFDCMCGVNGPYARKVLGEGLGKIWIVGEWLSIHIDFLSHPDPHSL
jgi:phosphoglucomutase